MSDYDYEEEYQYEEEPQPQEEDVGTRVELDYFEIEDLIRSGKMDKAINDLQQLYVVCQENNLKNYKIKILNQLLTIYSKNGQIHQIASTLSRISELNRQEKYTENALKAIITIVRGSDYLQIKKELLAFIQNFDDEIKLKSYLYLLERGMDEDDKEQSKEMFSRAQSLFEACENISAGTQLQFYSLDIKYSRMIGIDISDKVHQIELKIPKLQAEAYMSEGHISVLKLAFAEFMYQSGNYQHSAANIFDAFLEKAKYGSSAQLKEILKTNALICLLIEDPALRKKDRVNSLYHQSSIPFKNQADIQHLISLIEAYQRQDLEQFSRLYERVNFKPQSQKYLSIYQKLLFNMKKQKLIQILKSYQTIKFVYIGRRLNLNQQEVERIVFELIVDDKISGRINDIDRHNKFLEILPQRNQFLETQAENLRELGKRYLS